MKNKREKRFKKLFAKLPSHIQKQARDDFKIFKTNPYYKSFEFKVVDEQDAIYSVRIGLHYRALGQKSGDTMLWFWIGSHEDYNNLV